MFSGKEDKRRQIAVIGGGWSGCAAAVELSKAGCTVTLFESARTLGGRARGVKLDGRMLDNGQHILLGAYRDSLALMRTVGIDTDETLLRLPLQMPYPATHSHDEGMHFVTPRLPAPWHMLFGLLGARGLSKADKLSLARFSTTARWMEWRMHADCSVCELLERFGQTDNLIKLMWRPLCLAALNTPPERASAQVFLNVLRDSLGAKRAASDMLLPRVDLTELFPQHAARYIEQQGSAVLYGANVAGLIRTDAAWRVILSGDEAVAHATQREFDGVVLATQAAHAAELLRDLTDTTSLHAFEYEPITTCYLRYAPETRLARPFFALIDDTQTGAWGQFVFDRGQLDPAQAGILAVVVSASSAAVELDQHALAAAIAAQLAHVLNMPELAQPAWSKVISEKRATFACTPGLRRPSNDLGLPELVLAGDYTAGDYPATLEAAVRSGIQAAQLLAA
ncbi:MAG: FAD-dependent oxidoreductase [Burkholderiaceae bacterium]|nr:FAD-dependent oxidoreductase [Burkholderiaceae bacterium]